MAEPMLEVEALTKRFGGVSRPTQFRSNSVPANCTPIIGPNGAGKTTLIGQLTGEIAPDGGRIRFDGRDITALPVYRRSQLGLARSFQITSLFGDFTALDNVALAVQAHAGHSFHFWRDARREAGLRRAGARSARSALGLARARRYAGRTISVTASVASSRSRWRSATEPRMLLLDEPMAGMGPDESSRLVDMLRAAQRRASRSS